MTHSDTLLLVDAIYERVLDPKEAADWLARPISQEEVVAVAELVRWFTRRYPNAQQRLAYARRTYARWTRARQRAAHPSAGSTSKPTPPSSAA